MILPAALGPFQSPLGLAALLGLVPLIILYFVRSEPQRYALPTVEFLADDDETDADRDRLFERFRIHALLLIQAAVIVAIALALAGPQLAVPGAAAGDQSVVVIDTSASMQTQTGDGTTRFKAATEAALGTVGGGTTVVQSAPRPTIVAGQSGGPSAQTVLSDLSATDATGNLRRAIALAAGSTPDDEAGRIVIYSDFADTSDWQGAVASARASGNEVVLRQFAGGGDDNVGIVGLSTSGTELTATLANTGTSDQTRTVRLGDVERTVDLAAGDLADVRLPVPSGTSEVRLTSGDSFPADDTVYVPAPADRTVDVLLVSNDPQASLTAAFAASGYVEYDVARPPVADATGYDVVVFGDVDPDRLLESTVETARTTAANGGGVIVRGHTDLGETAYGDLLLVDPASLGQSTDVQTTRSDELTADVDLVSADRYVRGTLRRGTVLAEADGGSPMLATATTGDGRVLYYGYLDAESSFRFSYQYPVFWQDAVLYAAGQDRLGERLHRTGDSITFENETRLRTPDGPTTTSRLTLADAGVYETPSGVLAANLLSASESNVTASTVEAAGGSGVTRQTVTSLTPWLAGIGAVLVLAEMGFLRYRGEL